MRMNEGNPARTAARWRRVAVLLAVVAGGCLAPSIAEAQYFGRNKVQYSAFDFRVLATEHFDLHYYPELMPAAREAGRMAERWYHRLSRVLDHRIGTRQPLILYANHADFQQTNVIQGMIDESTGGVTEGLLRRVVMPLGASRHDTDHVLGHELVHAFQYDIANAGGGISAMANLPLWTIEGMAEYLSVGRSDPHTAMWLRDAVLHDDVPTLRQLSTDGRYFPYRFGQAVWAYIGARYGDERIGAIYRSALERGFAGAVAQVLEQSQDSLSAAWIAAVKDAYSPLLEGRAKPEDAARRVIEAGEMIGETMLAPAVSPDGRHVAFLWVRDLSIDLYVADARTGEGVRRLLTQGAESRFDALSFMGSAGAWSPDGTQVATVVFAGGRQVLAILDVASGRVRRQISIDGVNSIATPAWSPDGSVIAFSGGVGGQRDLYLLDVAGEEVRRLTDGRFAALQPAWSPDGRTIAFTTDRDPTARLETLEYGPMRIAMIDVASGTVRPLELLPGRSSNPAYTADGRGLYFLSDWDGFRDIYRVELGTGSIERITRLATGVSGLTPLSPALSIAPESGDLYFSTFERRGYVLRTLDASTASAAAEPIRVDEVGSAPAVDRRGRPLAGQLPPFDVAGTVETYLADATTGLPDADDFEDQPYSARPRLSYVGVPTIGARFGGFGGGLYANMEAYFTDVLGNRGVYVQGFANGGLAELGAAAMYENRSRRLNWGVGAAHVPYLNGYAYERAVRVDGQSGRQYTEYRERVQHDEAVVMAQYPFSTTRRIEFSAAALRLAYDFELRRTTRVNGRIVDDETIDLAEPRRYTLGQGAVALVGDHSIFGVTSPINGGRYRFEIAPTIGSLRFYTATADWRKYVYRRPFTVALRALHYGRYGRDAERQELGSLFIGAQGLVRGYEYGTFGDRECGQASDGPTGCATLDDLFGSRIALAGLELRLPLFGNERYGLFDVAFLPTELTTFVDAGLAWNRDDGLTGGSRSPVVSAGLSLRFNLMNALILETYYAVPFQRSTGGQFGIQITPGW